MVNGIFPEPASKLSRPVFAAGRDLRRLFVSTGSDPEDDQQDDQHEDDRRDDQMTLGPWARITEGDRRRGIALRRLGGEPPATSRFRRRRGRRNVRRAQGVAVKADGGRSQLLIGGDRRGNDAVSLMSTSARDWPEAMAFRISSVQATVAEPL